MHIVSYNLKRLFKWISDTTNRKWRDRKNGKKVEKKKILILRLNAIYGGQGGWGRGGTSQVNVQRTFSVIHFEF